MSLIESFRQSLSSQFHSNNRSVYLGEDVRNAHRGIAIGLHERFGDEAVIDMPISESAFTGVGLGLAITGHNVFVEFNFAGLVYLGLDQIFNQAHKYNEMMNTDLPLNLTYVLPTGTRGGLAGHHSDNPYALTMHLGIPSYMPSTPIDMQKIMDKLYANAKPTALYLPVASFQSTTNPCVPVTDDNFEFYKIRHGDSFSIVCTGTTLPSILQVLDSNPIFTPDIYVLTDLSLNRETVDLIKTELLNKRVLFIDDSFYQCGLAQSFQSLISRDLWLEPLTRHSKNVPFSQPLEDEIIVSSNRIYDKLSQISV